MATKVIREVEELLQEIIGEEDLPSEKHIADEIDYRDMCDCPLPFVYKKWHGALGRFVAIRLCCLVKAVERFTGEKLITVTDFKPSWEWDCADIKENQRTGRQELLGPPPKYLLRRMIDKGIRPRNLPKDRS